LFNQAVDYCKRIRGDKAQNLERAIAGYENALCIRTETDFPVDWATTQNNLAKAYSDRIRGDKAENLERAIACYQAALTIYTPQDDPINCLNTSRGLGYLSFKQSNWQLAIDAYSQGVEAVEQSREWAIDDQRKQEIISDAIGVYQNIVQACINLGQIDKAIEYVERGKARNLVDTLSVFIVSRQQEEPIHISYNSEQYQILFDQFNLYLDTYQQRGDLWNTQLEDLLPQLAQNLKLESIINHIKQLIADCNQIILVPHRWLHLLPIHALPLSDGKCLLDLFPNK
jgi:tetratricopeptide (TPR) repeat protein